MWIMSKLGFVSIVAHTNGKDVLLRFRAKVDAQRHKDFFKTMGHKKRLTVQATPSADYPYRMRVAQDSLADFLFDLANEVDYTNFKKAVTPDPTTDRAQAYMRVWSTLQLLTNDPDTPRPLRKFDGSPKHP